MKSTATGEKGNQSRITVSGTSCLTLPSASLESIEDTDQRIAMLTQILEFGQTPRQLFTGPHPQRITPKFQNTRRSSSITSAASELSPGSSTYPLTTAQHEAFTVISICTKVLSRWPPELSPRTDVGNDVKRKARIFRIFKIFSTFLF